MIERASLQAAIIQEIQRLLDMEDEIDIEEELESLGLDSNLSIKLFVRLEERFSIQFSDEDLVDETILANVEALSECIIRKIAA